MRPIGDHFYTTSTPERDEAVANSGYISEGVAFWAPLPPTQGAQIPFYRLFSPDTGDHFYTTSAAERDNAVAAHGYDFEGVACDVVSSTAPGAIPLHQLFNPNNGDHFYTTSAGEIANAITQFGYFSQGVACWVPSGNDPGTTPLYRLLNSSFGDHFYTTSAGERDNAITNLGYLSEGVACNVFLPQATSRTPFYRLFNSSSGDHLYTTSAAERNSVIANAGYNLEGVACEVFAAAENGTTPLYRLFNPRNGDHFYTTSTVERDSALAAAGYFFQGVACHVFGAAGIDRIPVHRLLKQFGAAFDANIILVGVGNFTQANRTQVTASLGIARSIFAQVGLQIRTVQFFEISVEQAGAQETIDSGAEAADLTSDWTVPNHALDLFVVRAMNGADGWSAINGSCDKDKNGKGMTGSVVSLNGSTANSGNTFAHEMSHYLGLDHIADNGNFIGNDGDSNSFTGIHAWQGDIMVRHCFVYDI